MTSGKWDPQIFFKDRTHVALSVAASEIFSLLKRSFNLPPKWAALTSSASGEHTVVSSGAEFSGADLESVLFVRVSPVEFTVTQGGLTSKDGFQCDAEVAVRVSVVAERGELLAFSKTVLGSRRVINEAKLTGHFQPGVHSALSAVARAHDATALVEGKSDEAVHSAVIDALRACCFQAGLRLEGKPVICFHSAGVEKVQHAREQAARRQGEHAAAAPLREARQKSQDDHLDHVTSLLDRLEQMAASSPDADVPELIRTFSQQQRGEVYQALFAAETPTRRTQWLIVVAGKEVLFFDPQYLESPQRRFTIVGSVGPMRSVQSGLTESGDAVLLLGASTGVYRLPLDRSEPDVVFSMSDAPSVRGGFNSAAMEGMRVVASHSELGLLAWDTANPDSPRSLFESMTFKACAIRNVLCAGDRFYCSIDDQVIAWPMDGYGDKPSEVYTGASSTIASLAVCDGEVFAGTSRGNVYRWAVGVCSEAECIHHGMDRAAESVMILSSRGVRRIFFTDTTTSAHARVLGDSFSCKYEAGGQTIRRVEVAPDLVVATNDLRDRLICWGPGAPERPIATIGISALCGHSVQDVCLVAQT